MIDFALVRAEVDHVNRVVHIAVSEADRYLLYKWYDVINYPSYRDGGEFCSDQDANELVWIKITDQPPIVLPNYND